MPFSESYRKQVALLIRVIPIVAEETCFALKGGTAINLFIRDMPRLSVDIDLTYLPIEPREEFLKNIALEIEILATNIEKQGRGRYQIDKIFTKDSKQISKLIVRKNESRIIIEPNFVLR